MGVTSFRELEAWQVSMDLVEQVYRVTAALSVPSNIAEGQGRRLRKQFALFLRVARGSAQEVETQLLIALRLGFADKDHLELALQNRASAGRLIAGLLRSVEVG